MKTIKLFLCFLSLIVLFSCGKRKDIIEAQNKTKEIYPHWEIYAQGKPSLKFVSLQENAMGEILVYGYVKTNEDVQAVKSFFNDIEWKESFIYSHLIADPKGFDSWDATRNSTNYNWTDK